MRATEVDLMAVLEQLVEEIIGAKRS